MRWRRMYGHLHTPESPKANPMRASRRVAELLRLLERHGFARRPAETPLEFASSVKAPPLAHAVGEFTRIYARARFGGAPCDTLRLRHLLAHIRSAPLRGSSMDNCRKSQTA